MKWVLRKRVPSALSMPDTSLPAMGWQPMKSTPAGRHCAASITAVFTPHKLRQGSGVFDFGVFQIHI